MSVQYSWLPERLTAQYERAFVRNKMSHLKRACATSGREQEFRRMRSCAFPLLLHMLTPRAETKFHVKPLPHARIPIVKLSLDPSPGLPLGIACDIGFENRLALENTRLLYCYAMIDPTRVRTMVLFRKCTYAVSLHSLLISYPLLVKVWAKRRYACYHRY